jgi:uncharacterized protein YrrD
MKKSVDILGLPVISINEGTELGTTKALVIDPTQGTVAAIAIEDGKWYLGAKLIPYSAVTGVGEYAITIENSSDIVAIGDAPDMEKLLAAEIKVIGSKVLTKSGQIQGNVTEIFIDDSGKIATCEVEFNGQLTELPADRVITYAKEVLIISADVDGATVTRKAAPATPAAAATVAAPAPAPAPVAPAEPQAAATEAGDESAKKFDDKQRKYLLGKKANRRIETDNGVVIIDQGGEITEEVIQKAKLAGKFVELSMSI